MQAIIGSHLWVQAPLTIPKLWRRYSVASYILLPQMEERLGEKDGAFFNGKEGRDDFRPNISLRRLRDKITI